MAELFINRARRALLVETGRGRVELIAGTQMIVRRGRGAFNFRCDTAVRELVAAGYATAPAEGTTVFRLTPLGEEALSA